MFQETLSGEAFSWFYELPTGSVGNFKELADKFVARFILCIDGINTPKGLLKVQQGEKETLKSFVNRWQAATTAKCRDLNKELAELAFRQGLRPGDFLYSINHQPPSSYDELMATTIRHAQAEFETYEDNIKPKKKKANPTLVVRDEPMKQEWNQDAKKSPYSASKRSKEVPSRSREYAGTQSYWDDRTQQYPRTPPPRYEVYTLLTTSYEIIWNENRDEIPGPQPQKFPKSKLTHQDTGRFCTYHEDAGHNTNLCVALKNMIESLVQKGKLQQYLPAKEVGAIGVYGRILTIHGGGPKDKQP
ncbi:uncharacterized protein LOC112164229 [Rosa chinensis]|uniref:uncharacterized protein LOC112164229 n=1 Tax=Rosa chinensis TaxID=74649 RepID=UPI000D08D160|nr:uncharacterized protein LOC112164229 [Rosa chinensis]